MPCWLCCCMTFSKANSSAYLAVQCPLVKGKVLVSESQGKWSSALSISSLVVGEERMRPGHWLDVTLLMGNRNLACQKTSATHPQRFPFISGVRHVQLAHLYLEPGRWSRDVCPVSDRWVKWFRCVKLVDRHQLNSLEAHTVEDLNLKGNPLSDDYKDLKMYIR